MMRSVPLADRRIVAPLIRARQEIAKRAEAWLPAIEDSPSQRALRRILSADARSCAGKDRFALLEHFKARARSHYPMMHLASRDPKSLPGARLVVAEAERVLNGIWSVFGHDASSFVATGDWRSHPLTGTSRPLRHWSRERYLNGETGGDVKFVWELNRHAELVRLAQAYHLTRDERFSTRLLELLDGWMRQNPPGRGINWTSALEVAFRGAAWCWIWGLTAESAAWTPDRFQRFLWQLWHHARHIEQFDSIHHSPNTHLTGEAIGLLYIAATFPELYAAHRWTGRAFTTLRAELDHQLLWDGWHFERSTGYHRYTMEFYLHLVLLARANSWTLDERILRGLSAMLEVSSLTRKPDGSWPVLGDEDGGDLLRLGCTKRGDQAPMLVAGAGLLERADWLWRAEESAYGAAWWLLDEEAWRKLARLRPVTPARRHAAFADAGYFVARDGWSDSGADWYCLVDAGPHGGDRTGHAHSDLGHVEIAYGSTSVISDPGCSTYTADPVLRDWFRSERAHASLIVNGDPLSAPSGAFSWRRVSPVSRAGSWDSIHVWCCELSYPVIVGATRLHHCRQAALVYGWGVIICDWILGGAPAAVALYWPLAAPRTAIRVARDVIHMENVALSWWSGAGQSTERVELRDAPQSPTYAQQRPGAQLVTEFPRAQGHRFVMAVSERERKALNAVFLQSGDRIQLELSEGQIVEFAPGTPPFVSPGLVTAENALLAARRPSADGAAL